MGLPVMQISSRIPLHSRAAHQVTVGHNSIYIFHELLPLEGTVKERWCQGRGLCLN